MNLDELQKQAVELIEEFDKGRNIRHEPATTMIHLMEEFGEIARELYNEKSGRDKLDRKNLAGEIADVYLLLAQLAKDYNIKLEDALRDKVAELTERHKKMTKK